MKDNLICYNYVLLIIVFLRSIGNEVSQNLKSNLKSTEQCFKDITPQKLKQVVKMVGEFQMGLKRHF